MNLAKTIDPCGMAYGAAVEQESVLPSASTEKYYQALSLYVDEILVISWPVQFVTYLQMTP